MNTREENHQKIDEIFDKELYASVVLLAEKLLADSSENRGVWVTYSLSLRYLNRFDEAERALTKAMELSKESDDHFCWLLCSMGQIYKYAGNYPAAIEYFDKAHRHSPDEATFLIYKGVLLFRSGKFDEAEKILKQATLCKKGDIDEAFYNLGAVLLSQKNYAQAINCFRKALEIDTEYKEASKALEDARTAINLI